MTGPPEWWTVEIRMVRQTPWGRIHPGGFGCCSPDRRTWIPAVGRPAAPAV